MPTNPAETPESEEPTKKGFSDDFSGGKIDRRMSVAPMMDWTDEVDFSIKARELQIYKKACPLYVSSKIGTFLKYSRRTLRAPEIYI